MPRIAITPAPRCLSAGVRAVSCRSMRSTAPR
jgi:hypothetical protein